MDARREDSSPLFRFRLSLAGQVEAEHTTKASNEGGGGLQCYCVSELTTKGLAEVFFVEAWSRSSDRKRAWE